MERLRFLASFPLPGVGKREGGEKTQPFSGFASHPVIVVKLLKLLSRSLCICTSVSPTVQSRARSGNLFSLSIEPLLYSLTLDTF